MLALALGAYLLVTGTRQVGDALGLQPIVSGLFITAFMTALPQIFTTWSVVRTGQVTSVFADHTMTFTLAVLPLAIVGVPIGNYLLVVVVMGFVALMPLLFSVLALRRRRDDQQALHLSDVLTLGAAVLAYLGAAAFLLFGRG